MRVEYARRLAYPLARAADACAQIGATTMKRWLSVAGWIGLVWAAGCSTGQDLFGSDGPTSAGSGGSPTTTSVTTTASSGGSMASSTAEASSTAMASTGAGGEGGEPPTEKLDCGPQ